jgi:hypothetical protein
MVLEMDVTGGLLQPTRSAQLGHDSQRAESGREVGGRLQLLGEKARLHRVLFFKSTRVDG